MLQNPLEGVVDDAPAVVQSRMYQNGRGVPQDGAEAAKWFRLAAEQGDAEAQHNPQPAAGGRLIAGARLDYGRNRGSIAVSQITPATAAFVAEQST